MTNNQNDVKNDPKRATDGDPLLVDAPSIVWFARQLFWFEEGNQEKAVKLLRCFDGLTDNQIREILRGNATMKNSRDHAYAHYVQREEKGFKAELAKHLVVQR